MQRHRASQPMDLAGGTCEFSPGNSSPFPGKLCCIPTKGGYEYGQLWQMHSMVQPVPSNTSLSYSVIWPCRLVYLETVHQNTRLTCSVLSATSCHLYMSRTLSCIMCGRTTRPQRCRWRAPSNATTKPGHPVQQNH